MSDESRLKQVTALFEAVGLRLDKLEQAYAGEDPASVLDLQFTRLGERLAKLEGRLTIQPTSAAAYTSSSPPPLPDNESETYKRLYQDLVSRCAKSFRFVRVAGPYYEESLEFRARRLSAESTDQLCKTMVMENTRVSEHSSDPRLSKYFLVLVQYTAAIDAEKLKVFVHKIANEATSLSKSKINMRMTSDDVAQSLTGYGHNAVTPLCSNTKLPIIMSDRITKLSGMFFMGAGEVDLKVGMLPSEFLKAYQDGPIYVVDCTNKP
eukprot:jgi/Ulvmu1/275/UM001_0279.1